LGRIRIPNIRLFLVGYLLVAGGAAWIMLGAPLPVALLALLGIPLLLIGRENLAWVDLPLLVLLLTAMAWASGRHTSDLGWAGALLVGLVLVGWSLTEAYVRRERVHSSPHEDVGERAKSDDLLASIAMSINGLGPGEIDIGLESALRKVGEVIEVDGVFVLERLVDTERLVCTHSWWGDGLVITAEWQDGVKIASLPWLWSMVTARSCYSFERLDSLPAAASATRAFFQRSSIQSACLVPMFQGGSAIGLIGLASKDEEKVWTESHNQLCRSLAELVVATLDRSRTILALLESEERYARLSGGVSEGLWDWDLQTDEVFYSARWRSMLGEEARDLCGTTGYWLGRVHPLALPAVKAALSSHLSGKIPVFGVEHRLRDSTGVYRWMLSQGQAVRSHEGRPLRMAGSLADISGRKLAEEQLHHDALHDDLTGLANRVLFLDRLEHSLDRYRRNNERLCAVLFLDLDRFKVVNDSLGPNVGDRLLVDVAGRLEDSVRQVDTVARLGGDEFVILLDDIHGIGDATRVADRILASLQGPLNLDGQEVFTTCSIGIALSSKENIAADDLMRNADIAMYRAKALGKSRYEVFDPAMRARAHALLRLETDLRRAVERSEFVLAYQPIVAVDSGRITGFEALLRWSHPTRGQLLPKDFLATAEETGLIVPIGWEVLGQACRQAVTWEREYHLEPPLTISVNLSGNQLRQGDLVEHVRRALRDSGLSPDCLKLEITEGVIMADLDASRSALEGLRALGVQLHLDDFGTGHSSLSVLHSFQVDTLKIDRSFVQNMNEDPRHAGIVDTIIALAQVLGKEVVAEGVETREQLARLCALRCQYAQGYYFSLPVDAAIASTMIDLTTKNSAGMLSLTTDVEP